MAELLTFGETMVSMTPDEMGYLRYVSGFRARIAGAESNVAIGAARLGHSAAFASAFGDDALGDLAVSELRREGVDVSLVVRDPKHRTGVMFKERVAPRETNVFYYRADSAASHMTDALVPDEALRSARILHLTGITPALSPSCREAALTLARRAKEAGLTVSLDPNFRRKLWSEEEASAVLRKLLPFVDVLLPGLDECALLFGTHTLEDAAAAIRSAGIPLAAVKLGRDGCALVGRDGMTLLPPYPMNDVVETVGAGDAFAAGFLSGLLEGKTPADCGAMANCMGAMATRSADDYQTLPDRRMLDVLLRKAPKPAER